LQLLPPAQLARLSLAPLGLLAAPGGGTGGGGGGGLPKPVPTLYQSKAAATLKSGFTIDSLIGKVLRHHRALSPPPHAATPGGGGVTRSSDSAFAPLPSEHTHPDL